MRPQSKRSTILLVDDAPENIDILVGILEAEDYKVNRLPIHFLLNSTPLPFSSFPLILLVYSLSSRSIIQTNPFNQQEARKMIMTDIRRIAKKRNIRPGQMKKQDLIRTIQRAEDNPPCFQTAVAPCDQYECCWRIDCLPKNVQ